MNQTLISAAFSIDFELGVMKNCLRHAEECLTKDKALVDDPKYNQLYVQHSITHQTAYINGLKTGIKALEKVKQVIDKDRTVQKYHEIEQEVTHEIN
jgi:hypothetical protein